MGFFERHWPDASGAVDGALVREQQESGVRLMQMFRDGAGQVADAADRVILCRDVDDRLKRAFGKHDLIIWKPADGSQSATVARLRWLASSRTRRRSCPAGPFCTNCTRSTRRNSS